MVEPTQVLADKRCLKKRTFGIPEYFAADVGGVRYMPEINILSYRLPAILIWFPKVSCRSDACPDLHSLLSLPRQFNYW